MNAVTAIVPAVTEPGIDKTLCSLLAQTVQPDRIIVALNNTDNPDTTRTPALSIGDPRIEVIDHGTCPGRKAEAINRTLATLDRTGLVLVMDADTELAPAFIETALTELDDPEVGGVGAVFGGVAPTNYIELCTSLEWTRYAEEIDRTGRVHVLSGTASLIRWQALEDVRQRFGHWYNPASITEDMALTMSLKATGWQLRSPVACRATTEMMPTVGTLFRQRRRWSLGAIQNVTAMGWAPTARPYWRQQAMLALSIVMLWSLIGLTTAAVALTGTLVAPAPFWLAVGAVFATERVITVWDRPWSHRLFAALVLPELAFALVLQAAHVAALWQAATGQAGTWAHPTLTPKEA